MKKIIIFVIVAITTILLTSCTTQQRVVYRNCNCDTPIFEFGWGNTPYWGWKNRNWYPYRTIPPYYIRPYRAQPSPPTRYERKTSIGSRPSRNTQNQSDRFDNVYPSRSPNNTNRQLQQRSTQPSRVQNQPSQRIPSQSNPTPPSRSRTQNKEN